MRHRAAFVTVGFGALLAITANLAWVTALATTGPWFSTGITVQAYSVSLVGATVLAVALAGIASSRASHLDEAIRSIEVRLATYSGAPGGGGPTSDRFRGDSEDDEDRAIDALLDELASAGAGNLIRAQVLVDGPRIGRASSEALDSNVAPAVQILSAHRRTLQASRRAVWPVIAGPIVVAIIFTAISGAMLPGSEGFATGNFRVNTTFLLFLGYGWVFLLAWSVVGLALLASSPKAKAA